MIAAKDKSEALLTYVQVLNRPNFKSRIVKLAGLAPDKEYKVLYEGDDGMESNSDNENGAAKLLENELV